MFEDGVLLKSSQVESSEHSEAINKNGKTP